MAFLEVRNLTVHFRIFGGWVRAVDRVSFTLDRGQTLGLVGESGCGKTTTAYAITQLLPHNGRVLSGEIFFREPQTVAALRREYEVPFGAEDGFSLLPPGTPNFLGRRVRKEMATEREHLRERLIAPEGMLPAGDARDRFAALDYEYDLLRDTVDETGKVAEYNKRVRKIRWKEISMIFQGAMNAFNPVYKISDQIVEAIMLHKEDLILGDLARPQANKTTGDIRVPLDEETLSAAGFTLSNLAAALQQGQGIEVQTEPDGLLIRSTLPLGPPELRGLLSDVRNAKLRSYTEEDARRRVIELFDLVGIPKDRIDNYPHEYSGGMRQRAMIAMALALNPSLVIADEPTTALDVITQDKILAQVAQLQRELRIAMIIITHDVSVVAETAQKVAVMYAGQIVEQGSTEQIFRRPAHPYTEGLLGSFPSIAGPRRRLEAIPGSPPDLVNPPPGCRFHPRCRYAQERCSKELPPPIEIEPGHVTSCLFAREIYVGRRGPQGGGP